MNSLTSRLFLYCGKTIACFLCSIALHLSVSTVQPYRSPLQQCIVGWEEPPSKTQAAMHSSTMAHWYQLHHNFITSSSLWILLTLTFYRDWQHRGRDAWQCQHLNPFRFRLLYSIVGFNILLFVDEVLFLCEQMVWIVKNPSSYSGITLREKARGIKKTRGWGDFKVCKVCRAVFEWWLAYCFDKCSLRRTCWGSMSLSPLICAIGSRAPRERQNQP